ncbi:type II toxin-antitoxin system RelE/ParE family toxin [candidate division KSB1 bacterium]|nr:type II toxin-antitoxin system RelE/ParE family toxin [candidate division KSB1 bacterium]MBL7095557.1 type II toxin-antitoxin system RelE/ParE family toxin [candidate division KSB1 bacterium]
MVKIKWSKDSIESLKEICKFIAEDSPYFAKIFRDKIFELVEYLEKFPKLGRKVPEVNDPNVREIIYKNYRIIYQIKEGFLEIIIIIHSSRLLKLH